MTMQQARTWSINALATELRVDRRTLAKKLEDVPPAEIRGKHKRYRMRDAIDALETKPRGTGGKSASEALRDFIRLPLEALVPWSAEASEHDLVVSLDVYEAERGLEGDEILSLITHGLPLLPPAEGDKLARVSVPHAGVWEFGMRAALRAAGLNWNAPNLGAELDRLGSAAA